MAIRRTMMNCIFDILFEEVVKDTSLLELVAVLLKLNRNPNQKPTRGVLTVFDMISRSLCSNCLYVPKRIIEVKQLRSCTEEGYERFKRSKTVSRVKNAILTFRKSHCGELCADSNYQQPTISHIIQRKI